LRAAIPPYGLRPAFNNRPTIQENAFKASFRGSCDTGPTRCNSDGMAEDAHTPRSDPLSSATRNTKRQLLVIGVVAITFKAFNVSIEKIPLSVLVINFDRGVFEFLLAIALAYLLLTFALYYYIDIRNFPRTLHQENTDAWKAQHIEQFIGDWYIQTSEAVAKFAPAGFTIHVSPEYQELLRDVIDPKRNAEQLLELKRQGIMPPPVQVQRRVDFISIAGPTPPGHERLRSEAEAKAQAVLDDRTKQFPRAFRWHLRKLAPRTAVVRLVYITRNYITDGLLPILIGVIALLAIYNVVDVRALAYLIPRT
jgi:hypothetical protein